MNKLEGNYQGMCQNRFNRRDEYLLRIPNGFRLVHYQNRQVRFMRCTHKSFKPAWKGYADLINRKLAVFGVAFFLSPFNLHPFSLFNDSINTFVVLLTTCKSGGTFSPRLNKGKKKYGIHFLTQHTLISMRRRWLHRCAQSRLEDSCGRMVYRLLSSPPQSHIHRVTTEATEVLFRARACVCVCVCEMCEKVKTRLSLRDH